MRCAQPTLSLLLLSINFTHQHIENHGALLPVVYTYVSDFSERWRSPADLAARSQIIAVITITTVGINHASPVPPQAANADSVLAAYRQRQML